MSTAREKDQKDYDLEQIVGIIDQALASNDPRIKDALRALMTVTVLCTAEHPDQVVRNGPLARVFEDYHNLARRLSRLEDEVTDVKHRMPKPSAAPYTPPSVVGPWIGTPTTGQPWTGTDPKGPKPMWGPSWTGATFSAGDDPEYKGASSISMSAEDFLRSLQEKH